MDGPGFVADLVYMTRPRNIGVVALLLAVVALGGTASAARSAAHGRGGHSQKQLTTLNRQVAAAINGFRRSHGLTPLHTSAGLNAAARQHSQEMGADGYFDHPSKDGTPFWKRIQSYYSNKGHSFWTVGENLLWASPSISASDAMKQWIASPEHLANLKDKDWRDLGVSAVHVTNAGGIYGGNTVTIITTDFGARR